MQIYSENAPLCFYHRKYISVTIYPLPDNQCPTGDGRTITGWEERPHSDVMHAGAALHCCIPVCQGPKVFKRLGEIPAKHIGNYLGLLKSR